jgi:cadherin 23
LLQTIRVYENASIDSEVTRVKAVDVDIGSNGAVRYRLRQDPLGNHRSFAIDEVTGVITMKRELVSIL